MKICAKCKLEKSLECFSNDKNRRDGKCHYCKECAKKLHKEYYEKNRDVLMEKCRNYYEENKEKLNGINKKYRDDNKDSIKNQRKNYREENKDIIRLRKIKYYNENIDKIKIKQKNYAYKYKESGARKQHNPASFDIHAHQISFAEKTRNNEGSLEVCCTYCGRWMQPTRCQVKNRIKSLDGRGTGENRFYCSNGCKKSCPIFKQKVHYKGRKVNGSTREVQPELRQMAMLRDDHTCQKCGKGGDCVPLHCHHIKAVADDPIESADLDNVITLCKHCHKDVHKIDGCGMGEVGKC